MYILLRDAANVRVAGIHGDVLEVVEPAENGEFADLGDAGEEPEADVGVLGLHDAVESLELAAEDIGERLVREVIDNGLVVFVNEDDDRAAGLGVGGFYDIAETQSGHVRAVLRAVFPFPLGEGIIQYFLQDIRFVICFSAQIEAQYRILNPVFLQLCDGEALEKLLPPAEVSFHRGDKQALAEAAGAAEEGIASLSGQVVDKTGLVHIDETVFADLFEILYADRVKHGAVVISTFAKIRKAGNNSYLYLKKNCRMKLYRYLPVLVLLLAVSCGPAQRVAVTLDDVESYINDQPDSALVVLAGVDSTALTTRALRARYALLRTMAIDKCYGDITTPGLLAPAVSWYEHHGSADEKMKALYYQGRIAQDCKDLNNAAVFYARAEEYAGIVTDKHALGVLYLAEASIYNSVHNIEKEKEYAEKGLSEFCAINDPMQDIALGQLAISYFTLRDWERADSLFRKGIASSSSNPYAQSIFLSNYARMKVLQPKPEPEEAIDLLERKQIELNQRLSLRDIGAYAYALALSGRHQEATDLLKQLGHYSESSPMAVTIWISRCALANGDYKLAYEALSQARVSEDAEIQRVLSDSVTDAISNYYNQVAKQKQWQYRINIAVLLIILLLLSLMLVLVFLRKNKIDDERTRVLGICSTLEKEAAEQEIETAQLKIRLSHFRDVARQERISRFKQAGRLRTAIWRLDHRGMPAWFTEDADMTAIKEELSQVYDIDDSGEKLVLRLDRELDGAIIPLLQKLNMQNKPQEQLFLCCCLLDLPSDVVAAKFGITPNNVRVRKHRLKEQIGALLNADYDSLFDIHR